MHFCTKISFKIQSWEIKSNLLYLINLKEQHPLEYNYFSLFAPLTLFCFTIFLFTFYPILFIGI